MQIYDVFLIGRWASSWTSPMSFESLLTVSGGWWGGASGTAWSGEINKQTTQQRNKGRALDILHAYMTFSFLLDGISIFLNPTILVGGDSFKLYAIEASNEWVKLLSLQASDWQGGDAWRCCLHRLQREDAGVHADADFTMIIICAGFYNDHCWCWFECWQWWSYFYNDHFC